MYVEIYTKDDCQYCHLAMRELTIKAIPFTEQRLNRDFSREQIMEKFPQAKAFPVIVVDGFYIGGYSNLKEHLVSANEPRTLLNE